MERLMQRWILPNWQHKMIALIAASIIWFFVNQSITATKTLPGVPIRVINLPVEKTIEGMMPDGTLSKRITLTLSGTKDVIEDLEPGEIYVVLDASNAPDDWVVEVSKQDIVSVNPGVDLQNHLTQIQHQEFVIELSDLVTAKIPITILPPTGTPPDGYQFLDIWPKRLMQTVSGPAEQIKQLRSNGLEITFDLRDIRKSALDHTASTEEGFYEDEVTFAVPESWKKVAIPFLNGALQPINDPQAKELRIDFLKMKYIPLDTKIPMRVFYPLETIDTLNPNLFSIQENDFIKEENGIYIFTPSMLAYRVSRLFIEFVKENMELTITARPEEGKPLPWSIEFMSSEALEDEYVGFLMKRHGIPEDTNFIAYKRLEEIWRNRFRNYLQEFRLYETNQQKLILQPRIEGNSIIVE